MCVGGVRERDRTERGWWLVMTLVMTVNVRNTADGALGDGAGGGRGRAMSRHMYIFCKETCTEDWAPVVFYI